MVVLREKVLQQLPVELTNSWINIVDERKFNADVGASTFLLFPAGDLTGKMVPAS